MSASKVLLVLGAGGNIGASVAKLFSQNGYQVALAARRLDDEVNDQGQLHIKLDLAHSSAVQSAFDKVTAKFGPPSVVVYNAAAAHIVPKDSPLDLGVEDFAQDNTVNTTSALAAAKLALQGFKQLPSNMRGTYVYTGNFLNFAENAMPALVSNGMGKSAIAHLLAVANNAYGSNGYRFYYADERKPDGAAAFRDISGDNSAKHYLTLAESDENKTWLQTFTANGYKDFSSKM